VGNPAGREWLQTRWRCPERFVRGEEKKRDAAEGRGPREPRARARVMRERRHMCPRVLCQSSGSGARRDTRTHVRCHDAESGERVVVSLSTKVGLTSFFPQRISTRCPTRRALSSLLFSQRFARAPRPRDISCENTAKCIDAHAGKSMREIVIVNSASVEQRGARVFSRGRPSFRS
jgi:hypothetical protein